MKVSVIVPFQKGISFLEDCFSSLRDQTYKDIEVILICDHVEENIQELINEYKESINLFVYNLEEKTGVAAARNLGIEKSTGDYIYFLDSDDYIYENALENLVSSTENGAVEVVYGKKKGTWFKRNIYFSTLQEDDNDEDENDQEDSAIDSAELDAENGGADENTGSMDDSNDDSNNESNDEPSDDLDEDGKSKKQSAKEAARQILQEIKNREQKAYSILLSKRKGIKNVSVLNILIKRTVIVDNHIHFNENFKYYSDFPFLVELLSKARLFDKRMDAKYVKRKHNDSVNLPALSQMKDVNRFQEYIDAYYAAIHAIPKDGDLRDRVDKKIIVYYAKDFAPKLRRSPNDAWRTERFIIMQNIFRDINPQIIKNLKSYRKKLAKALIKGNVKKSIYHVNMHLGWIKLKKLVKSDRARMKYLYTKFFMKKPMVDNWVIFESFYGKGYSDSPKYIYEYLQKNYPGKYRAIWVINDKNTKIPYEHVKVKRFTLRYAYYLARCKYYVFNTRQPAWVKKREGNIFLETWHGTPLKRLVFDQEDVSSASPRHKDQFYKQSRAWDYLIAANQFSSDTFRRCFMYEKEMLETGYPRNDIMHYDNKDQIAAEIRKKLNIPADKKTILYAPTWRDDEFYGSGQYKFTLKLDLYRMKEQLGDEYVVLLRTHYFIADSIDVTGIEDFAYNVSKYNDISELYLISDLLITDYSSVFFDYANLKRPMLFFTYDIDKYRDVLRGFYIDMEEELPGPLLYTSDEVIEAIKDIDQLNIKYSERYDEFYEKYCGWEDGHASEKVVKAVFSDR